MVRAWMGRWLIAGVFMISAILALGGCAGTAVVRQVEDTNVCGKGIARLIPTEGEVWLVLCEDGRVTWMIEEDDEL